MGDHFALLMDRLLTESTLEAVIASRNQTLVGPARPFLVNENTGKLVECRICQEEDEESNMETPCSCCGSLKYAHRHCVQRWCNEKGDTMCEICQKQFKPDYTAPPKLFHYGMIPMNFRGNWEVSRRDIEDHRFLTMVPSAHDFVGNDYDDYLSSNTRNNLYCRSVAIIFTVLLVLRHTLPIIRSGVEHYSITLFTLLMLRIIGIVLPLYLMLRAITTFRRRHQQQETQEVSNSASEGENVSLQHQLHFVRVL